MGMTAVLRVVLALKLLALAAGLRRFEQSVAAPPTAVDEDIGKGFNKTRSLPYFGHLAVPPVPTALRNGLVFIRPQKTGSSVFGGIIRRIAFRRGLAHAQDPYGWFYDKRLGELETPSVIAGPHDRRIQIANVTNGLMPGAVFVTIVRDPTDRCLSYIYFMEVSRNRMEPTSDNLIRYMHRCRPDHQFYLTMPEEHSSVKTLLASYSFVGVTERLDESALLLSKKLGVGLNDILYVKQKVSGSSVNFTTGHVYAKHPRISEEPEAARQFAERHFGGGLDEQLHRAAGAAIDEGIAGYGPGFQADLAEYRRRLAVVAAECDPQYARALSDPWQLSDAGCFANDLGCGQPCIDSVIERFQFD